MDLKISSCTGFALPVLLLSVALIACGDNSTTTSAPLAVTLARYNATGAPGTPDTSFGTQGVVTTDVNASQDDLAFAVVLQPDGKIIAVGTFFTAPASIVVIRYNASGTRDTTFGSNGITVTSLPSVDASAFAATLDADGKLLVAGRSSASSGATAFLLLRYHTNSNLITGTPGTLDAGFGTGGIVTTAIPSGSATSGNAIALSGTNILLAGQTKIGGKFVIALAHHRRDRCRRRGARRAAAGRQNRRSRSGRKRLYQRLEGRPAALPRRHRHRHSWHSRRRLWQR
jgi:uncharacterized delta-60 repeat protein